MSPSPKSLLEGPQRRHHSVRPDSAMGMGAHGPGVPMYREPRVKRRRRVNVQVPARGPRAGPPGRGHCLTVDMAGTALPKQLFEALALNEQLRSDNEQLRAENEALRNRVALLEAEMKPQLGELLEAPGGWSDRATPVACRAAGIGAQSGTAPGQAARGTGGAPRGQRARRGREARPGVVPLLREGPRRCRGRGRGPPPG